MKKHQRSWHHRRPRSLDGESTPKNLSYVLHAQHQAWHVLFQNFPPERIVEIINETWLDSDFQLILRKRRRK